MEFYRAGWYFKLLQGTSGHFKLLEIFQLSGGLKHSFDRAANGEQRVVAKRCACQHKPDRSLAARMARQRQRATIKEIEDGRIAQDQCIDAAEGFVVVFQIGDARRHDWHRWTHDSVKPLPQCPRLLDHPGARL